MGGEPLTVKSPDVTVINCVHTLLHLTSVFKADHPVHVADSAVLHCRFFSSLIQRSAQVHRRLKGGSMTMLAILPGQPAKGERQPAATAEDYPNLTPAQRDKLLAALANRQPLKAETLPGCVKTEVPLSCTTASVFCTMERLTASDTP